MSEFSISFYLFILLILGGILLLLSSIKFVPQSEEWTVERFGKFTRILQPGLNFLTPFAEGIGEKISKREHVLDIPPQDVITKDNAMVHVDGVVFFKVFHTEKAAYEVGDLREALVNLTMTNIRTVIGDIELDGVLSDRDNINHALLRVIDKATDPWGVKIIRIELKDVRPAMELQEAMSRQMQAEREKRARILEAQGLKEAAIEKADGERQAVVFRAEAQQKAIIFKAEAEKQKKILEAEAYERMAAAEAKSTILLSKAVQEGNIQAINYFVAKEYIAALKSMGTSENNKIIFMPLEASNVIGALGGITEIAKEAFNGKNIANAPINK